MEIIWYGQSCFKVRDKEKSVVIDPYGKDYGLKLPGKFDANLVLVTHDHSDHNNVEAIKGDPFIIDTPGEYEVYGITVTGIETYHDEKEGAERGKNTVYIFDFDGIRICHLGDLGTMPSDRVLERIDGVDILMIPVGGVYTIDGKMATKVISALEPRIVIPMHYNIKGLKTPKKLDGIENFCKEMGVSGACTEMESLKIKQSELPQEKEELIVLKPH